MSKILLTLILLSVLMSSAAQLVLKTGMSDPRVAEGLSSGVAPAVVAVGTNLWVLGGLAIYFCSALVWLLVLSRVQVSLAYPFVGLGFVVTMLLGWWLHGDTLNTARVAGTLLIVAGVVLLARS